MSEALYQRIAASLRERILSGGHPAGDLLPSENELADAYRTSRTTVRKAFQILESEKLIKPRQGKGYIVQPPRQTVFTMIFGENGERGRYRYLGVNILQPDAEVSGRLNLANGKLVVSIRRVLERDGAAVAFDEKFIPYERGVPSVEQELRFSELPDLFAERDGAVPLHTEMHIRAGVPPEYVQAALEPETDSLLTVTQLTMTGEGQRIGFARAYLTERYGPLRAGSGQFANL